MVETGVITISTSLCTSERVFPDFLSLNSKEQIQILYWQVCNVCKLQIIHSNLAFESMG
jgi:hypothetical protein